MIWQCRFHTSQLDLLSPLPQLSLDWRCSSPQRQSSPRRIDQSPLEKSKSAAAFVTETNRSTAAAEDPEISRQLRETLKALVHRPEFGLDLDGGDDGGSEIGEGEEEALMDTLADRECQGRSCLITGCRWTLIPICIADIVDDGPFDQHQGQAARPSALTEDPRESHSGARLDHCLLTDIRLHYALS